MSEQTAIQWTDKTWNPWQGCKKISEGCVNCYMFRDKERFGQNPEKIHKSSDKTFNSPLSWKDPAKVFICSWSDLFIKEADTWRPSAWEIIRRTPHLTYQILTKRPERIQQCLPDFWHDLKNVWLGVTVEKQRHVERITIAAETNPQVLFVSVEPMLEDIDLFAMPAPIKKINWVICGGESGPGYRPMSFSWAEALLNDCAICGIPFFMKQVSGVTKKQCAQIPEILMVREWPEEKK